MNNPYLDLTQELNRGRLRALLSSGQAEAVWQRPLLARIREGREILEEALDRERRALIRANEERLARYMAASEDWAKIWPEVQRQIEGLSLPEAHRLVVSRAEGVLPFEPAQGADS